MIQIKWRFHDYYKTKNPYSETVEFALHSTATGHLVLSTLHSTNATQSIERGLNFFSREYQQQVLMQLSYHLKTIISQRLISSESRNRIPVLEVLINTAFVQELLQKGELGQMKKVMESGRQERDSGDGFSKSWIGNPLN